jgi:hypothetical protein
MLPILMSLAVSVQGQMRDNRDPVLSCNDSYRGSSGRACDVQERTLGPAGTLDILPGRNGGVVVKGWAQNHVLVRARLEAWADTDSDARALLSQVRIDAGGGQIRGIGPDGDRNSFGDRNWGWAVSLEVFAPWDTNLKVESHNGGITVSDIRGRAELESHNGGLKLTRAGSDITGSTHNGGIDIEVDASAQNARQIALTTHNGGVTLSLPSTFSATVDARSDRGRLESDFPVVVRGRIDPRSVNFNIGAGGPLIRLSTHNGPIRLRRM